MQDRDYHPSEMLRRNSHDKFWPTRFLAVALSFWLSGMSCLFCCGAASAAETAETESCAASGACPMASSEAHDPGQVEGACCPEAPGHWGSSPCQNGCCVLDRPSSDLPPTPHFTQPIIISSPASWNLVLPDPVALPNTTTGQYSSSNRRETYLRCCVFLI